MDFDALLNSGAVRLLETFAAFVPNLIGAIVILLLGWLFAKWIARLIGRLLRATGIDNLAERLNAIDLIQRSKMTITPSRLLSKILYYFLLLIVIIAATDVLDMTIVSAMVRDAINYVPYLISAFIVFAIGLLIADFVRDLTLTACRSLNIPAAAFIANFVFYFLLLNFTMIALEQAQINTNFITDNLSIILAGIVLAFSIGYGLASRTLMANYLASFYSKNKVHIGDTISIDGEKGVVVAISNTTLTLQPEDPSRKVIIPLSKLNSEKVEIFQS